MAFPPTVRVLTPQRCRHTFIFTHPVQCGFDVPHGSCINSRALLHLSLNQQPPPEEHHQVFFHLGKRKRTNGTIWEEKTGRKLSSPERCIARGNRLVILSNNANITVMLPSVMSSLSSSSSSSSSVPWSAVSLSSL